MGQYKKQLRSERLQLLSTINEITDRPLTYLSFVWLGLIIFEFTVGISQALEYVSLAIWIVFIIDFLIEATIAPSTKKYLQDNWLNALSLLLPALRVLRIFRSLKALQAAKSLRSLNLLKLVSSLNRSLGVLREYAANYGIRYLAVFSIVVLTAGAAGILFFENSQALADHGIQGGRGVNSYGDALWWTVMLMTTIGSDYWPQTIEGRLLTIVLSFYAIAIFGYVTATLASLLVEKRKNLR